MNRTELEVGGGVCLGRKTEKNLFQSSSSQPKHSVAKVKVKYCCCFCYCLFNKVFFFNSQIDHISMSAYTHSKFLVCLLAFHPNAFTAPTSPPLFGLLPCLVGWIARCIPIKHELAGSPGV